MLVEVDVCGVNEIRNMTAKLKRERRLDVTLIAGPLSRSGDNFVLLSRLSVPLST